MSYTGARLDQNDHTILMALYRILQEHLEHQITTQEQRKQVYTKLKCSGRGLLADTGRSIGGSGWATIKKMLTRLSATALVIERTEADGMENTLVMGIVGYWNYNDRKDVLTVGINHGFIRMMSAGYSIIDWDIWLSLSGVGKTLYGIICTHDQGRRQYLTVQQFMEACGSGMKNMEIFKSRYLRPALEELEQAGIIEPGWIAKGGRIQWTRAA